ncbi:ligase-associated DNA damage response endonuclease PdeM [Hyunsoonleella pacifica]|uniref:Ligase-associated DNA damage response endonuclease PdeM n=2 Tax=Hyunsoonleella pacifica TaxID=1080224 RepID=A0A4Q9FRQ7_9FLAO|nr:ligase-associated DNA damage response endonuclease PdeM [Hyunsoonleella pacifica]
MTIVTKDIACNGEVLTLTNQRVVFWERTQILILSDLHIGKVAHFRKNGIPIPSDVLQKDLLRLEELIKHFNPKTLLLVGDLFHAELNSDVLQFKNWTHQFPNLKLILVKGNHDRQNFELYDNLNIEIISNKLDVFPFTFMHDVKDNDENSFYISGHMHPGVIIKGKAKQRITLPCYQVTKKQLILPAFSLFTGLNTHNPTDVIDIYAFSESNIFKI